MCKVWLPCEKYNLPCAKCACQGVVIAEIREAEPECIIVVIVSFIPLLSNHLFCECCP